MNDFEKINKVRNAITFQFAKTEFLLHRFHKLDFTPHFDVHLKPKTKSLLDARLSLIEDTGFDCHGILANYKQNLFVDIPRFLAIVNAEVPDILFEILEPLAADLAKKALKVKYSSKVNIFDLHNSACGIINNTKLQLKPKSEMSKNLGTYQPGIISLLDTLPQEDMISTYSHEFFHAVVDHQLHRFEDEKYPFPMKQRQAFVLFMTASMISFAIKETKFEHPAFDPYYHCIDEIMARRFESSFCQHMVNIKTKNINADRDFQPC